MSQTVTVLYFAWLRERVGTGSEALILPDKVHTVGDLVAHLASRGGGYASAFDNRKTVRCAVNQEFADPATPVRPGDEVGFFPPVTGG
jgi:molybdopterin synthase sulfur carrier subunit